MEFFRAFFALSIGTFWLFPCHGETTPASSSRSLLDEDAWVTGEMDELVPQTAIYYVTGTAGVGLAGGDAYLLVEPAQWESLSVGDVVIAVVGHRGAVVPFRLVRQHGGEWLGEGAGKSVSLAREVVRGRVYGVLAAGAAGAE